MKALLTFQEQKIILIKDIQIYKDLFNLQSLDFEKYMNSLKTGKYYFQDLKAFKFTNNGE